MSQNHKEPTDYTRDDTRDDEAHDLETVSDDDDSDEEESRLGSPAAGTAASPLSGAGVINVGAKVRG